LSGHTNAEFALLISMFGNDPYKMLRLQGNPLIPVAVVKDAHKQAILVFLHFSCVLFYRYLKGIFSVIQVLEFVNSYTLLAAKCVPLHTCTSKVFLTEQAYICKHHLKPNFPVENIDLQLSAWQAKLAILCRSPASRSCKILPNDSRRRIPRCKCGCHWGLPRLWSHTAPDTTRQWHSYPLQWQAALHFSSLSATHSSACKCL